MKFFKNLPTIASDDIYYDIFQSGVIKPSLMLEQEDAKRVNQSIEIINDFINAAIENEILEEI